LFVVGFLGHPWIPPIREGRMQPCAHSVASLLYGCKRITMSTESQDEYESKGEARKSQMKPRTAQLGARKNPDSPRVHGLRLAANSSSTSVTQIQDSEVGGSSPVSPTSEDVNLLPEDTANGTTVRREREQGQLLTVHEVADLLHVPMSWVYERTRRRGGGQLPHVKLGKYLRFEESTVTEFIRRQRRA
ncbi:MAG: helix-turn-helix domain-containing protein, partial [Candidatus Acidiferrales bacterium]